MCIHVAMSIVLGTFENENVSKCKVRMYRILHYLSLYLYIIAWQTQKTAIKWNQTNP